MRGEMLFNWQAENVTAPLQLALSGKTSVTAWTTVQSLTPTLVAPPAVQFDAASNPTRTQADDSSALVPLVVHRSQPLLSLIKSLNDYSNSMSEPRRSGWSRRGRKPSP